MGELAAELGTSADRVGATVRGRRSPGANCSPLCSPGESNGDDGAVRDEKVRLCLLVCSVETTGLEPATPALQRRSEQRSDRDRFAFTLLDGNLSAPLRTADNR